MAEPGLAGRARLVADRERHVVEGRPGDRDRGAAHRGHRHRGLLPARRRAHREGRQLHQHPADAAVAPPGGRAGRRRAQRPVVHLPPRPPDPGEARRLDRRDGPAAARPHLGLPGRGAARRAATPRPCWPRSTAGTPTGSPLSSYTQLKDDGSTACGCWIYCGVYADGVNQTARRKPGTRAELGGAASGAGPGRPTGGSSTTAPPPTRTAGRGASARRWSGGTRTQGKWTGHDVPDFIADRPPSYRPADGRHRLGRDLRHRPVHHAGRRQGAGCSRRPAWWTARCPRTTSRRSRRSPTCCTASSATRSAQMHPAPARTATSRAAASPAREVFPYVATTYRLTEHHTAGGMSRVAALPVRAAAGVLLRGLARAGGRARPGARGLGDDRHRAQPRSRPACW